LQEQLAVKLLPYIEHLDPKVLTTVAPTPESIGRNKNAFSLASIKDQFLKTTMSLGRSRKSIAVADKSPKKKSPFSKTSSRKFRRHSELPSVVKQS